MTQLQPSFCRICNKACPIVVEVDDGRISAVHGDRAHLLFAGYTCVKGRAMASFVNHPDRLLHSYRRTTAGELERIPVERAMDDIALRLASLIETHGPRGVAPY